MINKNNYLYMYTVVCYMYLKVGLGIFQM